MLSREVCLCLTLLPLLATPDTPPRPEILFADFEGADYGKWTATGKAFGSAPARGTLPGQMAVTGFKGKGLVNSFLGGDGSTGSLTSPEFTIERRYISFLIGGGGYEGKTCINLMIAGKVVRTVTGPNTLAGGSEELLPSGWDVGDLVGKAARLVIVDSATGGWGHINVDHIVFTDTKPVLPVPRVTRERTLSIEKRYLHIPVKTGIPEGKKPRAALLLDGKPVREFDVGLSDQPDWFAHLDVSAWHGRKLTLRVRNLSEDSRALEQVVQSDTLWNPKALYREPLRGGLHFSARRGWLNDPNGMVFADGEYHLFFQHNPYGWNWGNMHWGHAVSKDLVHWEELPIALYPAAHGDWAFSGSAVVDRNNTSGWKKGDADLLVLAYTSTGRGECMAYSNDRGRTWTEYAGNPVVKHDGRDPRLLWHEPTQRWVMAVYDEHTNKRWIAFYTSADLKKWTFESRIEGFYECPDLFELPVDGNPKQKKWVLTAADSNYVVGTIDGKAFHPETPRLRGSRGRGFYAAQTFSHDPQGRIIQMGWFQTATPGMPFNQAMTLPLELKLVSTADGPRLTWTPVKELEGLRQKTHRFGPLKLEPGRDPLKELTGELLEIRMEFTPRAEAVLTLRVRGIPVHYDGKTHELSVGDMRVVARPRGAKQQLTVYVDRTGLEVFASGGEVYVPLPVQPRTTDRSLALTCKGGSIAIDHLTIYQLGSIWKK